MNQSDPYKIIKHLHVTEKSTMLQQLHEVNSNPCIERFKLSKYVFEVAKNASKTQIKQAIEQIYPVKVEQVNTQLRKGKKRRVRGRVGYTAMKKLACVTLREGDHIETV